MTKIKILTTFVLIALAQLTPSHVLHPKTFTTGNSSSVYLDTENKYRMSWVIDQNEGIIEFVLQVETLGFIGIGISPTGGMTSADIFIGGVKDEDNSLYFGDYHGVGNQPPEIDSHSDWTVLDYGQNGTHTHLKISRALNTCDNQDYPITEETSRIIWSYGSTDNIRYHGTNRGTVSLYLIPLPQPHIDLTQYEQWDIVVNTSLPEDKDTVYWCTIHRGPNIQQKNHIVAFEALLNSTDAIKYTHHFIVYKCIAPEDKIPSEFFGPHVGQPGQECYYQEKDIIPVYDCQEYLFTWSIGGQITLFPEDVGYTIGENPTEEFYMIEIHYDNPMKLSLQFQTGVRMFHMSTLRDKEAGLLKLGHTTHPVLLIPPNQSSYMVVGHCLQECTNRFESQLNGFNVFLHAHLSGRQLKLRHFRNGQELPWIDNDSNYDFNFQQNKPLKVELKILPGDTFAVECVFDTKWNKGTGEFLPVYGGLSTREEMCQAFIWYYPKSEVEHCMSLYPWKKSLSEDFGIEMNENDIITKPDYMQGLDYFTALNTKFEWTDDFIRNLQQTRRYGDHVPMCKFHGSLEGEMEGTVTYPKVLTEYKPKNVCARDSSGNEILGVTFSLIATLIVLINIV